jgi:hypothetical protein
MKEEASTSEVSVNYQITRRNIPEDSHLHTRRRKNLKSPPFRSRFTQAYPSPRFKQHLSMRFCKIRFSMRFLFPPFVKYTSYLINIGRCTNCKISSHNSPYCNVLIFGLFYDALDCLYHTESVLHPCIFTSFITAP